jgi:hypothetical protein
MGQVDGNIHRLLTRLLAVHAPQTAPATIKFLWQAADELVAGLNDEKEGIAGDWNQVRRANAISQPRAPKCISPADMVGVDGARQSGMQACCTRVHRLPVTQCLQGIRRGTTHSIRHTSTADDADVAFSAQTTCSD